MCIIHTTEKYKQNPVKLFFKTLAIFNKKFLRLRALIFLAQDIDNMVRMETLQEKYARLKLEQQEESSEEESSEEESSEEEDGPEPEKTETLQE
eukprot:SAG11_NODE_22286_length_408_cov_5.055016_1_plen_93_part_01